MDEEKYNREVQTRERIMQVLLIISGFLLAYEKGHGMVNVFILFIFFAILYYIFLTRTKFDDWINLFAFISSSTFIFMLLHFMILQSNNFDDFTLISSFIVLTAIFTFAFLSPNTSIDFGKRNIEKFEKFIKKHPKFGKIAVVFIFIVVFIIFIYQIIKNLL